VKGTIDPQRIEVALNRQIGSIHLEHDEYQEAIPYFERVISLVPVSNDPDTYFLMVNGLIRSNRHIGNYHRSLKWVETGVAEITKIPTHFVKLSLMGEYIDLLNDWKHPFDYTYGPIIKDVQESLGFENKALDPIELVMWMRKVNKRWNRWLGEILLLILDKADLLTTYEKYIDECEIDWYKKYVHRS
jgi:hypothetical protein